MLDAEDQVIRKGIAALLAERLEALDAAAAQPTHWTAWQGAAFVLHPQLTALRPRLEALAPVGSRSLVWSAFRKHAYQWF